MRSYPRFFKLALVLAVFSFSARSEINFTRSPCATLSVSAQARVKNHLSKIMKALNVPGMSVAVMRGGDTCWTTALGARTANNDSRSNAVNTATLFQAGSVSKPVAAFLALSILKEKKIDLDESINSRLRRWKIPAHSFHKQVTLRQVLSHTGGLTVHGYLGYQQGESIPNLVEILDGAPRANSDPVYVEVEPGTEFRYSGGGYVALQQYLLDVTGEVSFPELAKATLFNRIHMNQSTFEQPLPMEKTKNVALGHDQGVTIPGGYNNYPEMTPAGLWTTPSDLAIFLREVQKAVAGKSSVLDRATALKMLSEQTAGAQNGLGFFVAGNKIQHWGGNVGYVSLIRSDLNTGDGFVIMTNSYAGRIAAELMAVIFAQEFRLSIGGFPEASRKLVHE